MPKKKKAATTKPAAVTGEHGYVHNHDGGCLVCGRHATHRLHPRLARCDHAAWEADAYGAPRKCADCGHRFSSDEVADRMDAPHVKVRASTYQTAEPGKIRMRDEAERKRVLEISTTIVASQVARGEVDVDDDEALRKATREAVITATAAYRAAIEYMRG